MNDPESHPHPQNVTPSPGAPSAREVSRPEEPSMTWALFVSWILPCLVFALASRYTVHLDPEPDILAHKPRPVKLQFDKKHPSNVPPSAVPSLQPKEKKKRKKESRSGVADIWPTNYQSLVETIDRRRRRVGVFRTSPETRAAAPAAASRNALADDGESGRKVRGAASDPDRLKFQSKISNLRAIHQADPTDIFKAIDLADAYRMYELQFHDGGLYEDEAIASYQTAAEMSEARRQAALDQGRPTHVGPDGQPVAASIHDELMLDYPDKSPDGLLCAVYTARGKVYYMANMFARAVQSYTRCLEIEPFYLDALDARASAYIILGQYEEAARDFVQVIERDQNRLLFSQSYTGLARVLEARENATQDGWGSIVHILDNVIPTLEAQLNAYPQMKQALAPTLNRLHHVMFTYNDVKTRDYPEAFRHLTESFRHKMSILPPWRKGFESQKVAQAKQIFKEGFWPTGMGSPTRVPIFIIGFVRSGSTLLERVLDAHPMIVGTGENSVFNGRLDDIRNKIVEVSTGQPDQLGPVTRRLAEEVVDEMKRRWRVLEANTDDKSSNETKSDPQRFVDKMLTNYYNVGFIHLLYPNALILHVARLPMDTCFSAYKHEFPPGTLDYTSDFEALAELYHAYRDLMEHWDRVLPGRVTHVRYQDMVHDMPGVARAIIDATGLPWDDSVLDFHKKKHAVNTLSSTQVRKGVYKDSLKAWMRYKDQLGELLELIGDRIEYDMKTTLPTYRPPDVSPAPVVAGPSTSGMTEEL